MALSHVVRFDDENRLQFTRPEEEDLFVFGADVFDKGNGDIRIAETLLRFKEAHPLRVFLLAGNRDLNKLRFTAEVPDDDIDVPPPVPLYPRAPPQVTLRSFLEKVAGEQGVTVEVANTKANRLRWILDHTMTAKGAFEYRREELCLLKRTGAGVGAEEGAPCVTDDEVVSSFMDSVERNDGFVWRYLTQCHLAVLIGNTLFVHADVPKDAPGWVPTLDMRYLSPGPEEACGGRRLPEGHTLKEWVDAMNAFLAEGLRDFRAQMTWRADRSRGGEGLLVLTSTPACFRRSIVVESLLQEGTPTALDPEVEAYLAQGGVQRVISGHKPSGDSPFVVRKRQVEFVSCDLTFSDPKAKDTRGKAVAAVEIEGGARQNRVLLRGVVNDGRCFDFALPTPGNGETSDEAPPPGPETDAFVGRSLGGGRWVKARLGDGSYHIAASKPGDRAVTYTMLTPEAVAEALQPLE